MLLDLLKREVTIIHRGASSEIDEFGNEIPALEYAVTVGELQQTARAEAYSELSETTWLLVLPAGSQLTTGDQVSIDGSIYELKGDPWHAVNPRTGLESHVEATLRRTDAPEDESES